MTNPLNVQHGGTHYKALAIQPVEYAQRNELNFCEASVVKYITRHRDKNGKEDLQKAIHFIQMLIAFEYPETAAPKVVKKIKKKMRKT
jgi:hypothetical protein